MRQIERCVGGVGIRFAYSFARLDLGDVRAKIIALLNWSVSVWLQRLRNKTAGHMIDPGAFVNDGVHCFDHHAVVQKTILHNLGVPTWSERQAGKEASRNISPPYSLQR